MLILLLFLTIPDDIKVPTGTRSVLAKIIVSILLSGSGTASSEDVQPDMWTVSLF